MSESATRPFGLRPRALLFLLLTLATAAGIYVSVSNGLHDPVAVAQSCRAWSVVPAANVPTKINVLSSVAAAGSNDIWAVGIYQDYGSEPNTARTLTLHWDGTAWTLVPSPNPYAGINNYLDGVAIAGPNDVWAVGDAGPQENPQAILVHWDGKAWSLGKLPPLNREGSSLYSVYAVAPNDIWAVGSVGSLSYSKGLILHYDGNNWLINHMTAFNGSAVLYSVAARSANDVWAVGAKVSMRVDRMPLDVRLHWDGQKWEEMAEDDRPLTETLYSGWDVAVLPGVPDVWIAGLWGAPRSSLAIMHFDGAYWSRTGENVKVFDENMIRGIAASSKTDLWVAGYGKVGNSLQPLLGHSSDGLEWVPDRGAPIEGSAALYDIAALPNADYVAVGTVNGATLVEMYTDKCAPTPTMPPTPPPTGLTATATPVSTPTYPPIPIPGDAAQTFAETSKTVKGLFLEYWQKQGGLVQQGYPISDMFTEVSPLDRKPYTVQYFERAVFEYHSENQAPYNVLLSQLGTFQYKKKYPGGAPGQTPNTSPGSVLFAETGHRVGGRFLEYWQQNGGLVQQGYPISDEFQEKNDLDGKTYTVQYFERAVFEQHLENQKPYDVLLSQLGMFRYREMYGKP